uniref:Secreted protein n=1 Tax=Ixodes scapularis TaxID=6945 RepID=A0A4D5RXK4_IXOSC
MSRARSSPRLASRMGPATLALWWQTCTGLSSTAAFSCTRPARTLRPESCVCFTSASRWVTWWSVPGAWPRRASRPSWTCSRLPCTAGRPFSWDPRGTCRTYWTSTRSPSWVRCNKGCLWLVSWPGSEKFTTSELFWPRCARRAYTAFLPGTSFSESPVHYKQSTQSSVSSFEGQRAGCAFCQPFSSFQLALFCSSLP